MWKRECGSKCRYSSPEKAWASIRKHTSTVEFNVYRCSFCRTWHFGHAIDAPLRASRPYKRQRYDWAYQES
jgi:hypothetical protein